MRGCESRAASPKQAKCLRGDCWRIDPQYHPEWILCRSPVLKFVLVTCDRCQRIAHDLRWSAAAMWYAELDGKSI